MAKRDARAIALCQCQSWAEVTVSENRQRHSFEVRDDCHFYSNEIIFIRSIIGFRETDGPSLQPEAAAFSTGSGDFLRVRRRR